MVSLLLSLHPLGDINKRPESSKHRLCPGVFTTLLGADEQTAVCSTSFRRDFILVLLNPYHIISAVTALQAAAQLEVECRLFCVLNIYLPIDLSFFFPSSAAGIACFTAAIRLAATSHVYW